MRTRASSRPSAWLLRQRDETVSLGFAFIRIGDKLVVSWVNPDGDAWWAGVRAGMTLTEIAGETAITAYRKAMAETRNDSTERSRHYRIVRKIVAGDPGTQMALAFERFDGTRLATTIKRSTLPLPPRGEQRVLASGFGYIHFSQWTFSLGNRAIEAVKELRNTPGLIIDLRGQSGRQRGVRERTAAEILSPPHGAGPRHHARRQAGDALLRTLPIIKLDRVAQGDPDAYTAPVVILMSAGSASASELFASAMQSLGRAKVVGQESCGCLLGFLGYASIPGGGELAYSEVAFSQREGQSRRRRRRDTRHARASHGGGFAPATRPGTRGRPGPARIDEALGQMSSLNPGVARREVWAWAMYDFANSGYTTVVLTAVFNAYFVSVIAGNAPWATFAWTAALSVSYAIMMVIGPILGASADAHASKKRQLAISTVICILGTIALAWTGPGTVAFAVVCIVVSNVAYSMGENLTAAFLPELSRPEALGRVSGWGWSLGYFGGIAALAACLAWVLTADSRGSNSSEAVGWHHDHHIGDLRHRGASHIPVA